MWTCQCHTLTSVSSHDPRKTSAGRLLEQQQLITLKIFTLALPGSETLLSWTTCWTSHTLTLFGLHVTFHWAKWRVSMPVYEEGEDKRLCWTVIGGLNYVSPVSIETGLNPQGASHGRSKKINVTSVKYRFQIKSVKLVNIRLLASGWLQFPVQYQNKTF